MDTAESAMQELMQHMIIEQDPNQDQRFRLLIPHLDRSFAATVPNRLSLMGLDGEMDKLKRDLGGMAFKYLAETDQMKWIKALPPGSSRVYGYTRKPVYNRYNNHGWLFGLSVTFRQRDKAAAFKLMFGQAQMKQAA